ncbi:DUF2461 domain-containing protein [Rubrivirga sp.]|uniref:DUF2461 domain-containing protein n=1 Tax=Rubrivirga sp. TaxID=1885344 RepID=UPI003B528674
MLASPPDVLAPFPGLTDDAFDFLKSLKRNNDREWFRPRKDTYVDELREPMRMLVADLSRRLPERGLPLTGDPKRAVFRIYRDTRFSKNKAPYKTHVAAVLSRDGDKRAPGALYVHVEPGATRVGGGFWRADKDFVRLWRTRLSSNPDEFLQIVEAVEGAGLTLETAGSALTRMPRGFEDQRENAAADYFRWRGGFAALREDVTDDDVLSPGFADLIVETAEAVRPLLEYGWRIADEAAR